MLVKITAQLLPWLPAHPDQRTCIVDRAITWSQMAQALQRTGPLHPAETQTDYDNSIRLVTELLLKHCN